MTDIDRDPAIFGLDVWPFPIRDPQITEPKTLDEILESLPDAPF